MGSGVLDGSRVCSMRGVGVQVGGSSHSVAVDDGTMIVAGSVGLGNGLMPESGLIKMVNTRINTTAVAIKTTMVRISQIDNFMNIPLTTRLC